MEKENKSTIPHRRAYILIKGELKSPLLVGSGESEYSDMDVILDERGCPFIPGSALAGALRSYLERIESKARQENKGGAEIQEEKRGAEVVHLFGGFGVQDPQSRLLVCDTRFINPKLGYRDGVRLNEYKTAQDQAKYTMQIVEPGSAYEMRLELVGFGLNEQAQYEDNLQSVKRLLAALHQGEITLGARSRRGFGHLTITEARCKEFDMRQSCREWLDWSWTCADAFAGADIWELSLEESQHQEYCLRVPLKVDGTIMIRNYTAKLTGESRDYAQLRRGEQAVIPGSSWMGAIRGRLAGILCELDYAKDWETAQTSLDGFFGTWEAGGVLAPSPVKVEESVLEGGKPLPITRTAIDRFTGGALNGALYTEEPWVGGTTELILRWPRDLPEETVCGLLLWVVKDLQAGLLAVGGETAVGRGIFAANGSIRLGTKELDEDQCKRYYQAAIDWCKGIRSSGEGVE